LAELPGHGDAHLIVKGPVPLQVSPNILEGNLIGLDAGASVLLVHEIADNVVLSDVFRVGELDALRSLEVEAGIRDQVDEVLEEARSIVFSAKLFVQAEIDLLFFGLGGGFDELEKKVDEGKAALDAPAAIFNAGNLV
jgi:hypothetical protein